jgi:uncharacterized Zn finger protein
LTPIDGHGVFARVQGIANILHRETLAMIVGGPTFKRGQECFTEGRVLGVESAPGELCGMVQPQEDGRAPYEIRIWVRDEGLAFQCTCPIGVKLQFCKHAVAVTLAHLQKERLTVEQEIEQLRERLMEVSLKDLLDGLVRAAKVEPGVHAALKQICANE